MQLDVETDRFVKEVLEGNEYAYVFKDMIVVDLGCNIGTFDLWIYKLARVIYAVDLSKENINGLTLTIQQNKLDKIKPYLCAIGGTSMTRYVKTEGIAAGGSWSLTDHKTDREIQCYTLNDFIQRENIPYIDLLKMDVEGAEFEICESNDFPAHRIRNIVGEVHGGRNAQLNSILTARGFQYYDYDGHFMARRST